MPGRDTGRKEGRKEGALTYWLGDAAHLPADAGECDLVYASSFTPNEMCREPHRRDWPAGMDALCPLSESVLARHLAPGGLYIEQSYAAGVPVDDNPAYLAALRAQLARLGMQLLEQHYWASSPGVSLSVAQRSSPAQALERVHSLESRPKLDDFHGRSTAERGGIRRSSVFGEDAPRARWRRAIDRLLGRKER